MQECDLLQAVEPAAFRYLAGYLINRIGTLLVKRFLVAFAVYFAYVLVDQTQSIGDLTGLIIGIGIAIWSIYDLFKVIRRNVDRFRSRIWQQFKRLPQQLLDDSLIDCLNRKPECCELFQREVSNLLQEWVNNLKPGWKKRGPVSASIRWRQMERDIKRQITDQLRECCAR